MPYPFDHAASVLNPELFQEDSFRRVNIANGIGTIMGKLKNEDTMTIQSYRFDKTKFTAQEAIDWLKEHEINVIEFEEAEGNEGVVIEDEDSKNMNDKSLERKWLDVPFKVKAIDDSDNEYFTFKGYASTFGNVDFGGDVVVKGAFRNTLMKRMPKLVYQHDIKQPLGIFTVVKEDEMGLYVEGKMPKSDTLVSGRVMPQMKIGSIDSMSISYNVVDSARDGDKFLLKDLDLFEISVVTLPMNTLAKVTGYKSYEDFKTIKDVSNFLKSKSLTKNEVEMVITKTKHFAREQGKPENIEGKPQDVPELQKLNIEISMLLKTLKGE